LTKALTVKATTYIRAAYTDKWGHRHPVKKIKRRAYRTTKARRRKRRKRNKWYTHKATTGWKKTYPKAKRRALALEAHEGDRLATARGLMALANITEDEETKVKAGVDARYFYKLIKEVD